MDRANHPPLGDALHELAALVAAFAALAEDPPDDASVDAYAAAEKRLPMLRAEAEAAGYRLALAWGRLFVGSLPAEEKERIAAAFREALAAGLARVPSSQRPEVAAALAVPLAPVWRDLPRPRAEA